MVHFVASDVDVLKILTKYYGYSIIRQKGSHIILKDGLGHRVTVPYHNKELSQYTLHQILKETGLSREEIQKYL